MKETTETYAASLKLKGINIASADPPKLADFYKTVLNANVDESHGGTQRIEIWFGDKLTDSLDDKTPFIVVNYAEGSTPPASGTCQGFEIQVSDVNAEYKRIRALGIEVKEPPQDLPWGYRYFHLKDPDGNGIDIVQKL